MTTLEYAGTEKALWDWGFTLDSCQCRHVNLATSIYTGFIPGASVSDDPAFAFESKVIIRRNRSGSVTTWTGGYVAFIGYALAPFAAQSGSGAGVSYQFANAWYFLENTCFEMRYASYSTGSSALEYKYLSEIQLFTKLDGSELLQPQDSGEQIEEILQFIIDDATARSVAQPFIIGTIDPAIEFPSYQAREMMCAAALLKCLELSPDVSMHWDYTTTLGSGPAVPTPTVHFYSRASRTAKSLAILNGTDHKSLNIVPRHDLVVRSVVIQYKITGSADGNTWIIRGDAQRDKYGPNGANHASDPDKGLRVLRQTIDLQGALSSSVSTDITCVAVDANHATDATRLAWWKKKVQWLNSDKIASASIVIPATATIKDDAGSTVSLATYPNELTRGQIATWTGFVQKWVTITAKATYNKYHNATAATAATANLATEKAAEKELSVRLLITDAETGVYSTTASYTGGEDMPAGIAQAVYTSLATLQYEGEDIRLQDQIMNPAGDGPLIHLGHKLNLTGGRTAWETMVAQVQSITEHDGKGETSISFGPARHIAAGDLAAMFQWNRLRRYWENPRLRETADFGAGGSASLGEDVPKENSQAGSGTTGKDAVSEEF
jgi:hypothetical protein